MSRCRASRNIVALSCVLSSWCFAAPLRADSADEARASFESGVAASRAERWEEARSQFQRSLELLPKASTIYNLVIADIKLGLGREALEQLDAFERTAHPQEHAAMLERAPVLRGQALALVQSEQSKAQNGGNALSPAKDGLNLETRRDVELAREHYANGRDREALAAFESAYRSSKRPELLYNIGVVADRMRADVRAIRAYEAFIAALPDAPEAAVAQVRSEALRAALLAREEEEQGEPLTLSSGAPTAAASATSPVDSAAESDLTAPRALLTSGGVLAAGAGGALGWLIDRAIKYNRCASRADCENLAVIERERRAALITTVASASLAVGLIAAGAVVRRKRKRAARESASSVAPWVTLQAAGVTFQRRF